MDSNRDSALAGGRRDILRRAIRLEYLTVGWNLVEGGVAITAAVLARSIVLFGFGVDSFVESASGLIMIWRLRTERSGVGSAAHVEAIEHRARRLVALSLFLLAAYVVFDAVNTLRLRERPEFSPVGIALTAVSLVVMVRLARAKRQVGRELGSRAMQADAGQTTACWWLSLATLLGVALNGIFGWWWADPVTAILVAVLIVREGREAWRGDECCG